MAKAWLLDLIERTPPREIRGIPMTWVLEEGPALVSDILRGLGDPAPPGGLELPAEGLERVGELAQLRHGAAAHEIPRDLAALQALLVEALRREIPERRMGAFAGSVARLAEIFGDVQAQVSQRLVRERSGDAAVDPVTGLPGEAELHEWFRILISETRHDQPLAVLVVDVDGIAHIHEAYGRDAGERILDAVASLVRRQIPPGDRAFLMADHRLCVLSPQRAAADVLPLAERLCELVDEAQDPSGPRIAISAGIASCPEHGSDSQSLLDAAEEASWAAKAAGRGAAVVGA